MPLVDLAYRGICPQGDTPAATVSHLYTLAGTEGVSGTYVITISDRAGTTCCGLLVHADMASPTVAITVVERPLAAVLSTINCRRSRRAAGPIAAGGELVCRLGQWRGILVASRSPGFHFPQEEEIVESIHIIAVDIYDVDLHPWRWPTILRLIADAGLAGLGEFPWPTVLVVRPPLACSRI